MRSRSRSGADLRSALARAGIAKGPEVSDRPSESPSSDFAPDSARGHDLPRPAADDFQPDIPTDFENLVTSRTAIPPPTRQRDVAPTPDGRTPNETPNRQRPADDVHLVPGARIAGGRYRLQVFHGGAPPLQFWQAMDTALHRPVALTFVDPDGALPDEVLQEILARTLRLSRIDTPGVARVLDVVHTGPGGLVVSEWIRGGSLQEVADTAPSPVGAVRAMQSLAAAAEAAHRAGVALSIDHPQPGARQHRGRRRAGLPRDHARRQPARRHPRNRRRAVRPTGQPVAACRSRGCAAGWHRPSGMPRAIPSNPWSSTVIFRSRFRRSRFRAVQEDGGIRSASTLLNLLQQATAVADRTEVLGPIDDSPDRRITAAPPPPLVASTAAFA